MSYQVTRYIIYNWVSNQKVYFRDVCMVSSDMLWASFLSSWSSFSSALISGYQKGLSLNGSIFRATLATPDASQWPPLEVSLDTQPHTYLSIRLQVPGRWNNTGFRICFMASWLRNEYIQTERESAAPEGRDLLFFLFVLCILMPVQIHVTFNKLT